MNDSVPIGIDGYYALCFKNNKCKTEFDIQTKFSTFGRVISVRKVGSENGIVFVRYKKQSEANACFAALRNDHVYRVEIPRRTKGKGERKGSKRNKQQPRGPVHNQPYRTYSGVPEQDLHGGRKPYVHQEPQNRTKDIRRDNKNIKHEEKPAPQQTGGSARRKDNKKEKTGGDPEAGGRTDGPSDGGGDRHFFRGAVERRSGPNSTGLDNASRRPASGTSTSGPWGLVERERTGWYSPNTQQINVQHSGPHSKSKRGRMVLGVLGGTVEEYNQGWPPLKQDQRHGRGKRLSVSEDEETAYGSPEPCTEPTVAAECGTVEEYNQGWPPLKQDQRHSRGKHSSVSEDEETAYGSPEPCTEPTVAAELSPWEESDDNYEQPVMSLSQAEADEASQLVEDEGACSLAILNTEDTEIGTSTAVRADYGGWPPPSPHGENTVIKTEAPTGNVDELERLKFLTLGTPGPRAESYEPFGGLEKCWSRSPQWEPPNETQQNPIRSSSASGYGICDVSSSLLCQPHLMAYGRAHSLVNLDQARAVVFPSDYYSACHSFYEEEEH